MEKERFIIWFLSLVVYLQFKPSCVHGFPMTDCRTSNIDLLIVFDNYVEPEFCINQDDNRKFISGVLDVFLAPEEENLTRLYVAVAAFTASGPVTYLPFQNGSRQDVIEKINKIDSCSSNESPLTDNYSVMQNILLSSINFTTQESYGNRLDAKDIVIFMFNYTFGKERLLYDYHDYCREAPQACIIYIYFVVQYTSSKEILGYTVTPNSVAIKLISLIAFLPEFRSGICSQCYTGWFEPSRGNNGKDCYYLEHFEKFTNWEDAKSRCQEKSSRSSLAAIHTQEDLSFLDSEILVHLLNFHLGNHQVYTIRNFHYLYIYLDVQLSAKNRFTLQSQDTGNNYQPIQNWISGTPHRCGAWLIKFPVHSLAFNYEGKPMFPNNSSTTNDNFTQGWVDIPCGHSLSRFALCKYKMEQMIGDGDWHWQDTVASETSVIQLKARGEYHLYVITHDVSRIMSLPIAFMTTGLDLLPPSITSSIRSMFFSCHDYDNNYIADNILPYSFVCNHKSDCENGRDEKICNYRECEIFEYQCVSSSRCISSEAVCDMFKDCEDGSDEQFCQHTCIGHLCCTGECIPKHWVGDGHIDCTGCDETDEKNDESISAVSTLNQLERCVFICNRTQCVYPSQLNDGVVDCQGPEGHLDETIGALQHISKCRKSNVHRSNVADWAPLCVYVKDRYGTVLGCRDRSHLQDCANFFCPEGYKKCPGSYCIPVQYWGDGIADCPAGEEEYSQIVWWHWRKYYFCDFNNVLLHPNLVCDGHVDCRNMEEDELNCHVSCAAGFICLAGTVTVGDFDRTIPLTSLDFIDDRTRYLDLSGVDISYVGSSGTTTHLTNLIHMACVSCNITNVGYGFADAIGRVSSIYWMNLSYNVISEIPTESIFRLTSNLRVLDLSHNRLLIKLQEKAFDGSVKLEKLNLSFTSLAILHYSAFQGLTFLKLLNLSHTEIDSMRNKNFPETFKIHTLDLRGSMIIYFEPDTFDGLRIEMNLYTDIFSLCCPDVRGASIPEHTCHAPLDSVSSCTDLIGDQVQRMLLWVMGIIALLGNTTVIVYRLVWDAENLKKPYFMFVTNLGVSDFLMGVYLVIIAGADVVYKDVYVWNDREWRYSVACKIAGFLSTLSSETSMLFIFLVTLDRLLVMKFPFGEHRISRTGKVLLAITAWVIGLVLSFIPLLPIFDENNIYTSNALCLGLPLTSARPDGWGFSMGVFIVFNFTMFLIIAVGQFMIYRAMSSHKPAIVQNSARRAQDIEVAKTLLLVVLSDMLCWFPIGVLGLSAFTGKDIGREAYVWSAVLVLPVNSALNPLLYTIPVIMAKWKSFKYGLQSLGSQTL